MLHAGYVVHRACGCYIAGSELASHGCWDFDKVQHCCSTSDDVCLVWCRSYGEFVDPASVAEAAALDNASEGSSYASIGADLEHPVAPLQPRVRCPDVPQVAAVVGHAAPAVHFAAGTRLCSNLHSCLHHAQRAALAVQCPAGTRPSRVPDSAMMQRGGLNPKP